MDLGIRAISKKHNVKISIVNITEAMKKILKLQKTNPIAGVILSRITAANALISLDLKNGESMNTNIVAKNGYLGTIIAEYQENQIRSFIKNPQFDASKVMHATNPFNQALGCDGTMLVGRYLKNYQPYISTISLIEGGVDANFMEYLKTSNQIHSFIATKATLNANLEVDQVVGILVQLLPDHTDEDIDFIEHKLGNSDYITDVLIKSFNYHSLLSEIVDDVEILDTKEIIFKCTCNEEKILNTIKLLGEKEIAKMIQKNETVIVHCDFCQREYQITNQQLKTIN